LDVDVHWLAAIEAVEEESVRTRDATDCWHLGSQLFAASSPIGECQFGFPHSIHRLD
jgi:hypothetical protein